MPFYLNTVGCARLQLRLRGGSASALRGARRASAQRGPCVPGRAQAAGTGAMNNGCLCPSSRLGEVFQSALWVDGCCVLDRSLGLAFLSAVAAGFLTFLHVVTKLKGDSPPSGTDLPASSCFLLRARSPSKPKVKPARSKGTARDGSAAGKHNSSGSVRPEGDSLRGKTSPNLIEPKLGG